MKNKYILRNKQSGWYLNSGGHHTSDPANVVSHMRFNRGKELNEALVVFGHNYEAVSASKALPVA
jgi:hypothetical protein